MKMHIRCAAGILLTLWFGLAFQPQSAAAAVAQPDKTNTVIIQVAQFQFLSGWKATESPNCFGGHYLANSGMDRDALTVVDLPTAGRYRLWTRSRCYKSDKAGTRRYLLVVNGQPAEKESGLSSDDGWIWEQVGSSDLVKGANVLGLRDTAKYFGRCDAILLTTTDFNPATLDLTALQQLVVAPTTIQGRTMPRPPAMQLTPTAERVEVARVESDQLRLIFLRAADAAGQPVIVRKSQLNLDGKWQDVPEPDGGESLYLIQSANARINLSDLLPSWPGSSNAIQFDVRGKTYEAPINAGDPFMAGDASLMVPRQCRRVDDATVEIIYESASHEHATGRWQIQPGRRDAKFTGSYQASKAGDYSLAFCAAAPIPVEQMQFVLLPPEFRFQCIHPTGFMVTSSATSHPLSLVELANAAGKHYTTVVTADPEKLPFQWAQNNNAKYGFSLRNAQEQIQPTIFQPVLGLPDSRLEAGQTLKTSCYVLTQPGAWTQALEYASQTIFHVTDYRQPWGCSLSQAALNLFDLLKDDVASGWDAKLKGFYQIESQSTVSQCSPLAVVEAALLSQDETLYVQRALPTIEFSLSRPGAHFAVEVPPTIPRYVSAANTQLQVPSKFFGTAYWQGLHDLLGQANPWIAELALQPGGAVRWNHTYSAVPKWSELLAAYRLAPTPAALEQITQEADKFLAREIYGPKTGDIDLQGFCNVHVYPYWWDLIDLYETTHDAKYLSAAEQGGFHTVASLWSLPTPPPGNVTVNQGGTFDEHPLMWWRNDAKYRLGWPRHPGDTPEAQVPAWLVANAGLGIEQLTTYYDRQGTRGMQNILMSCWAPHLLRLYQYTGREIFLDYARNGIIGRFNNYPGYYVAGYTNTYVDPRYPYQGPDVTDIYYHHIPSQLAFTLDFLVTQAAVRSKGAIAFPWVKQQGYVWFSNRIYGSDTGQIFHDQAVELRLQRQAAQVSSEKISYLMGRGKDHFWLILMNEANAAVSPQVRMNPAFAGLATDQPYEMYAADGKLLASDAYAAVLTPSVPAKGLIALAFPAAVDPTIGRKLPPVTAGHVVQQLPEPWQELHAFRIRSPFAKDSLYVVLTGKPKSGVAAIQLDGADHPLPEVRQYPYEFSVYPWPMDRDMAFRLTLTDADGKTTTTTPVTLPGTKP